MGAQQSILDEEAAPTEIGAAPEVVSAVLAILYQLNTMHRWINGTALSTVSGR